MHQPCGVMAQKLLCGLAAPYDVHCCHVCRRVSCSVRFVCSHILSQHFAILLPGFRRLCANQMPLRLLSLRTWLQVHQHLSCCKNHRCKNMKTTSASLPSHCGAQVLHRKVLAHLLFPFLFHGQPSKPSGHPCIPAMNVLVMMDVHDNRVLALGRGAPCSYQCHRARVTLA